MDWLLNAVQTLLNMGAVAILPVMILIIGLIFRMKFGEALKAGLLVGIGFQGLSLVISLLFSCNFDKNKATRINNDNNT